MNKLFFLLINIVSISLLFAQPLQISQSDLIDKIIQNEQFCVKKYEENKIYIKSQKIIVSDEGLFIDINGYEFYLLPNLQ